MNSEMNVIEEYRQSLNNWYILYRREFPWRYTFHPYKVLVSEILLQQTNVEKVIKPYKDIINSYSTIEKLSNANLEYLKDIFQGLGLFYRAERLIDISSNVVNEWDGQIPCVRENLIKIKGIGNYSCNAILCFGYNQRYAIVDTNVIRVIERVFSY